MKKFSVLNLFKPKSSDTEYLVQPNLLYNRDAHGIDVLLQYNHVYGMKIVNDLPLILFQNLNTNECSTAIEFYYRINNEFFGQSVNGKCIYGFSAHPWHKKVKQAEFTLFESEVDFKNLYHFDSHNGRYVPEFSNVQNWMRAYHNQHPDNFYTALDYIDDQPDTPELDFLFEKMH